MKEKKTTPNELKLLYETHKEEIRLIIKDEIKKAQKEFLDEIKNIHNMNDKTNYENNYLIARLKIETKIGYQAIKKLIDMSVVQYDGKHFDFNCETIGVLGSFFVYIKFKKPQILSQFVTYKGNTVAPITFENGGKNSPTEEWISIEKILNNQNLTKN